MRKVTREVCGAFMQGVNKKIGNTESRDGKLFLHGNMIARLDQGILLITNAGWTSNTTKEHLNGLPGVSIQQKNFTWFLNGKEWGGDLVPVNGYVSQHKTLKSVAMVAQLGNILFPDNKQKGNEWKKKMIKAGIGSESIIFPDNWEELQEEEKEKRLDSVINELRKSCYDTR